jgi:hypothetical protein
MLGEAENQVLDGLAVLTPRIGTIIRCMTSRQFRIGRLILFAAFAALGIWALAEAKYGTGTFWLALSVAWLLLAIFRDKIISARERQRARLSS